MAEKTPRAVDYEILLHQLSAEKAKVAEITEKYSRQLEETDRMDAERERLRTDLDAMQSVIDLSARLKMEVKKLKQEAADWELERERNDGRIDSLMMEKVQLLDEKQKLNE